MLSAHARAVQKCSLGSETSIQGWGRMPGCQAINPCFLSSPRRLQLWGPGFQKF